MVVLGAVLAVCLAGGCSDSFEEGADWEWDVGGCESYYGGRAGGFTLIEKVGVEGRIENSTEVALEVPMTVTYTNEGGEFSDDFTVSVAANSSRNWSHLTEHESSDDDFWLSYGGTLNCSVVPGDATETDGAPTGDERLADDDGPPNRRPSTSLSERDVAADVTSPVSCDFDAVGAVHATGTLTNVYDETWSMRIWVTLTADGVTIDRANDIAFDLAPGETYAFDVLLDPNGASSVACTVDEVELQTGFG